MTDMTRLRRKLKKFLAPGVRIKTTKLEAGEALILVDDKTGEQAYFDAVGDDHTFLSVGVNNEDLT